MDLLFRKTSQSIIKCLVHSLEQDVCGTTTYSSLYSTDKHILLACFTAANFIAVK